MQGVVLLLQNPPCDSRAVRLMLALLAYIKIKIAVQWNIKKTCFKAVFAIFTHEVHKHLYCTIKEQRLLFVFIVSLLTGNDKGKTCISVPFPYSSYLKIPWARLPDSDSIYENTGDFPRYVSQRLTEVLFV
jgi:hypothetical protein